jgi:polyhydroxyalkanoate synthase
MAPLEELSYGADLLGLDPASLAKALAAAGARTAANPLKLAQALGELALDEGKVALDVARATLGADGDLAVKPEPGDRRFTDRAWTENPLLRGVAESYLVWARWSRRVVDGADVDEKTRRKAQFALGALIDALAPSNVPWLNPSVVKEAIDTGGLSVARGFTNYVDDLVHNGGRPRQVDTTPFEVGKNLAATPGRVVFRNELMELLAFEPQTETVFAEPFFYSPPWINKYYVMDLAPGRSFIEYAVKNGFTVFAISYRNPDRSMADVRLDDYLRDGWLTAVDRVAEITGAPRVNVVATCIGGTLSMMGLAVLAARDEAERVGWTALTVTLVDYSEPGDLGVFADEATIERIEKRNAKKGFLDAPELAGTFNWLRGNDLVWNYAVANWGMGKQPPAFDILAWNADSTRLPAAMHSQFLRTCYLQNALARPDAFEIDGTPVDMSRVETPLYVLSAEADHIAPWRSSYRTTQLVSGDVRHVLTSSGHIAGMVNPPGNAKAAYWVNPENPPSADEWRARSERVQGSWWEDWLRWASERSGERVPPPELPPGEPAPGRYVLERA